MTTTLNFGDRPAGCIAIAAARLTADMFGGGRERAAWFLKNRTYVDDATAGADTMEELRQISADLEAIVVPGGFKFKETMMSGDKIKNEDEIGKVLGLRWNTEEDELSVDIKLNFGGKVKGAKLTPDADLENDDLELYAPEKITKRMLWRVAMAQYDPLGLLCGYTIKFKLLMRNMAEEAGKVLGWDDEVGPKAEANFRQILEDMASLRQIKFKRSIKPPPSMGKWVGKPTLLVFGDGSREASCALAYIRWEMESRKVYCQLIAGKTKVAPKVKISIPRVELVGSQLAVRLARKVKHSLKIEFEKTIFFTDSSAVLGMINQESAKFNEFVGTRVSEIRALSDPVKEWFWIPTDCNLADMGTRPNVRPEEMDLESAYQKGMDWMRLPASKWPAKKTLSPPPVEELRKDLIEASALAVRPEVKEEWPKYPVKNVTIQKVKRIYGYVFLAAAKWLKKDSFVPLVKVDGDRGSKYSATASPVFRSFIFLLTSARINPLFSVKSLVINCERIFFWCNTFLQN